MNRSAISACIASILSLFASSSCRAQAETHHAAHTQPQIVTVEMAVRDNRVFVPLHVTGPNGKSATVLFWVDSGGDAVFVSGVIAHELGLRPLGPTFMAMGDTPSRSVSKPSLSIAGMPIHLAHVSVDAPLSSNSPDVFAGVQAGGFLPATVLSKYDVVIDYPARKFTLALPGAITHQGAPVRLSVKPKTGFARVQVTVGRKTYGFMLDTGAAYTGISSSVMDRWLQEHPAWPHSVGAVGAADMAGKQFDLENQLIRVPKMRWGPLTLRGIGMVSRPAGLYESVISKEMSGPIIGALAGNVLSRFRLELDYPDGMAYLEERTAGSGSDLNCVGLVVLVRPDGGVLVSGVVRRKGKPEVVGVERGDMLVHVNGRSVEDTSLANVLLALSGSPGETKRLTLRRGNRELNVTATVFSHP